MSYSQRRVTLHTPGKMYSGLIDLGSETLRTIDVFNSSSIYWRDPADKSFDDALLLHDANVVLEGGISIGDFKKLQIKLTEVVFFSDNLAFTGNFKEKMRAQTLKGKVNEDSSLVRIITKSRSDSFYYIQGVFHGLFKAKTKQRFIPIAEATVTAVVRAGAKWEKRRVDIHNNFVGINVNYIESCSFTKR